MRLHGANTRILKQPSLTDVTLHLQSLAGHGANTVALNTIHYVQLDGIDVQRGDNVFPWTIFPDIGQPGPGYVAETVDPERLYAFARIARSLGLQVMLKPMFDCRWLTGPGGWRGYARVPIGLRYRFEQDYKHRLLEPLFPIVKELDAILCFGTELVQITRDYRGAIQVELAKWLKGKGQLGTRPITYAANWGSQYDAEWWQVGVAGLNPYVDAVGVDAYWPFDSPDAARTGWRPIVDMFTRILEGKPLWFTEVGWPNAPDAATNPFGNYDPSQPPSYTTEVSSQMWQTFFEAWSGTLDGFWAWEAAIPGSLAFAPHNILDTPMVDTILGAH